MTARRVFKHRVVPGMVVDRLTVISETRLEPHPSDSAACKSGQALGRRAAICRCSCPAGNVVTVDVRWLLSRPGIKSCGCAHGTARQAIDESPPNNHNVIPGVW